MPDIKFACPGCKVTLKVNDALAGKKIKCPKCGAVAPIPAAPAQVVVPPPAAVAPAAVPERPFIPVAERVAPPAPGESRPAVPIAPPVELFHPDDRVRPLQRVAPAPTAPRKKPKKAGVFVPILAFLLVAANVAGAVVVYLGILLPVPAALPAPDLSGKLPVSPGRPPAPEGTNGEKNPKHDPVVKPPKESESSEKPSPAVLAEIEKFSDVQANADSLRIVVKPDAGDRALVGLAKLPKQSRPFVLDLSKMKELSDPSLGDLRSRTDLTELNLSGAKGIFDSGLAHLVGMKRLQVLNLTDAEKIDDAGLNYLTDLTALKKIVLTGTKVTDAGIAKLKKALPKVEVVR